MSVQSPLVKMGWTFIWIILNPPPMFCSMLTCKFYRNGFSKPFMHLFLRSPWFEQTWLRCAKFGLNWLRGYGEDSCISSMCFCYFLAFCKRHGFLFEQTWMPSVKDVLNLHSNPWGAENWPYWSSSFVRFSASLSM